MKRAKIRHGGPIKQNRSKISDSPIANDYIEARKGGQTILVNKAKKLPPLPVQCASEQERRKIEGGGGRKMVTPSMQSKQRRPKFILEPSPWIRATMRPDRSGGEEKTMPKKNTTPFTSPRSKKDVSSKVAKNQKQIKLLPFYKKHHKRKDDIDKSAFFRWRGWNPYDILVTR